MPRSFLIRSKAQFRNARSSDNKTRNDSTPGPKCPPPPPQPNGEISEQRAQNTFTTPTGYCPVLIKSERTGNGGGLAYKEATVAVGKPLTNDVSRDDVTTSLRDVSLVRVKTDQSYDVSSCLKAHNDVGFTANSQGAGAGETFISQVKETPTKPSANVTPFKNRTIWSPVTDLEPMVDVKRSVMHGPAQIGQGGCREPPRPTSSVVSPFTPLNSMMGLQQPLAVRVHAHVHGELHNYIYVAY